MLTCHLQKKPQTRCKQTYGLTKCNHFCFTLIFQNNVMLGSQLTNKKHCSYVRLPGMKGAIGVYQKIASISIFREYFSFLKMLEML